MLRAIHLPTAALAAAAMVFALGSHAPSADDERSVPQVRAALASSAHQLTLDDIATLSHAQLTAEVAHSPAAQQSILDSTTPTVASAWWGGLTLATRAQLVHDVPDLIGALDGLPAEVRVAANRVGARERLGRLDFLLTGLVTHEDSPSAGDLEALERERAYLTKVALGLVQLYLYNPVRGSIVEMAGDPAAATGILFVVPGTNASIATFMNDDPVTSFANWQVQHADPSAPILAFTVLAAPMPQISVDLASGPQNNTIATAAGADYAHIVKGIDAAFPGLPTLSYEHSAGSQVGSAAEMAGARFTARFLAAGVGATDGYTTVPGTAYYATQAKDDINRYYAGFQMGDIGYGIGPEEFPGITIVDPGFSEKPTGTVTAMLAEGLTLHNRLFSGDGSANGTVLKDVRLLLTSLADESSG
ncbi:hypothetical protein [Microbacterium sp. LMI1x-1-1.1]|uniref:hypothetical protein n=1 Tax=Microbacterium sp. LMI1x-1-1.1 TaxID=3135246 RepID=UPI00344555A5